jgi:hypothetical protein
VESQSGENRDARQGRRLTVSDIKGLLTRIGHELVRSLEGAPSSKGAQDEPAPKGGRRRPPEVSARPVDAGRFVESMRPFLRMN